MTRWPKEAGSSANDARAVWAMHAAARHALVAATKLLGDAGVPSLAVKGVVTAHSLYREPTERPIGDVDVRIRPEDFRQAACAFEDAGWRILDWKPVYGAFVAVIGDVKVDVESVIGAPGLCRLSIADMLSRAVPGAVGFEGTEVRVPEVHDHAVLLAVNVFKDKLLLAAPWAIEDARRIVDARGFDARRFVEVARRAQVAGIVWIVADWIVEEHASARRTVGGGWAEVRARLGGESGPRPVYAQVFRWLLRAGRAQGLAIRVLARAGGDAIAMWAPALARAVAVECRGEASWRRER